MRFIEWIIRETSASPFNWYLKYNDSWSGTFEVDGINFRIDIYGNDMNANPSSWEIQIQQVSERRVTAIPKKLGFQQLAQVFQTLDEAMVDFVGRHPDLKEFVIHPIVLATHTGRVDKMKRRNDPSDDEDFDVNKFFAYQKLFEYSSLKQLGFSLRTKGEYIIIYR